MSVKLSQFKSYDGAEFDGIGGNSVDTSTGDAFVTKASQFVTLATSATAIEGVSLTRKAFTSDNQTVAKARLGFIPKTVDNTYDVTISGGTITVADEGKFYNLNSATVVDGTSESTVGQLKMIKFLSATNSRFEIV